MFDINHWTFTALKQFENCPRQYAEIRIHRNYKDEQNEKGQYGDRMHKAAEDRVRHGTPLPQEFGFIAPVVDALLSDKYDAHPELEMAIKIDGAACDYHDVTRWYRGKADLVLLPKDGTTARVVDYKTGNSRYADKDQLELMALMVFAHHAHIEMVRGALLFVLDNTAIFKHDVHRREVPDLLAKYRERNARRVAAFHAEQWPARRTGLCRKHCVVLSCEYNGRQ